MSAFARTVVGVDGTDWGYEALRQALVLAPVGDPIVRAITALDTAPAIRAGFQAPHLAQLLEDEASHARDEAERIIGGKPGCSAHVVRGKPVDVLRRERDGLQATVLALGGRRSSRFLGIMLGDTGTELVHDAACSALLSCPSRGGEWRPRKIVVGLDSSNDARGALKVADEVASVHGGEVEVISATGGKAIERGAEWSDRVQTWDRAHPVAALVDRSRHADLVVVGSRGLHGVGSIGSVSERLAHQAHCTALIVHASLA